MTSYLIQLNVALILFYGIYHGFLRKETNFTLVRFYLLFSLLASASLPFIEAERLISYFVRDADSVYEYWLPDIAAGSSAQITNHNLTENPIWRIAIWMYFAGVTFFAFRLLRSFFELRVVVNNSKMKRDRKGWYYLLDGENGSFSFFNYIFIGSKSWYSEQDKESILTHERAHVRKWHSVDIMVVQLLGILVWINPIIYRFKKTLEELHEYEADLVTGNTNAGDYCALLAKDVLTSQFSIANHFNKSLTVKRITMIQSTKKEMSNAKKVGVLGAVILLVMLMACEEKVLTDLKRAAGQSVLLTEYPKEVQDALNTIKAKSPNAKLQVYGVVKTRDIEQIDLKGKTATMFFRENDPNYKVYVIVGADDLKFASSNLFEMKGGEKIYSLVDEPASPMNGMTEFYKYVAENLKYPQQARQMGVEGRVFLRFMVDEAGKISNVEVVRGIGAGCDAEAMRVMSSAPNWKPGMQDQVPVKSIFNLAIIFKLNEDKKEGE